MSEQDLTPDQLEQLREQLASVSAGDVIAEAALSLIALAYVRREHLEPGTPVAVGADAPLIPARVAALPFA